MSKATQKLLVLLSALLQTGYSMTYKVNENEIENCSYRPRAVLGLKLNLKKLQTLPHGPHADAGASPNSGAVGDDAPDGAESADDFLSPLPEELLLQILLSLHGHL